MRRWFGALAIAMTASGAAPCLSQPAPIAPPAAIDPERLAIARQVIDLSFPPEERRATLMRAVDVMTEQARAAVADAGDPAESDPGVERIIARHLARMRAQTENRIVEYSAPLFTALARAYARQFSRDELVEIRAFVSTPTGRKYIQRSTEMLADPDVARANTAYMSSVFSGIQAMQAELRADLIEYMRTRESSPIANRPIGTR